MTASTFTRSAEIRPTHAARFAMATTIAARISPRIAENVTLGRDYTDARCFLAADGCAGFAILPDGELVSVWSTVKGRGDAIVATAVAQGATHLDCFVGHLTRLYARHGFHVIRTVPNWDGTGPAVAFMARSVSAPIGDHAANVASWDVAADDDAPTARHAHTYRADIKDWWCIDCDTVTDYCTA